MRVAVLALAMLGQGTFIAGDGPTGVVGSNHPASRTVGAGEASWPMMGGDAGRTGFTPEGLPQEVTLRWTYKPDHPPAPAWPSEPRMPFDRTFHVAADGETLYFGSSADCQVYALDAASGRERWRVFTGGPVRLAPALWRDRLIVASDDGLIYALSAKDGRVLWQRRPGGSGRMILGNDRMISKWPARGGPAVADGVVYCGAGIWPSEGIFICALDAASGTPLWINDTAGAMQINQPHGASAKSGVSCQGYLAVGGDRVFVPTGRAVPAAFNRANGAFLYFHLHKYGKTGGTTVAAIDSLLVNGRWAFEAGTGEAITSKSGYLLPPIFDGPVAAGPKRVFVGSDAGVAAFDRATPFVTRDVEGKTVVRRSDTWDAPVLPGPKTALIVAGGSVICGGTGFVGAIDIDSRARLWRHEIEGTALGLAVAGGRLFVSTETGAIHCFGAGRGPAAALQRTPAANPYPKDDTIAAAAEEIIRTTGITEGYALDLGCGDGHLAFELATRTRLRLYGVDGDAARVAVARERLAAAGLYGVRVTVHQADLADLPYPNYFADLVVSGRAAAGETVPEREMTRCLKPGGGTACLGRPGAMQATVRGPLEGAGAWTHQYADAANTTCSGDALARGPLTVLWFGGPDQDTPNRHGRGPGPLFGNGRLYVQGRDDLWALDAYNGRRLWRLALPGIGQAYDQEHLVGVAATGSNMCLGGDNLYVRLSDRCLVIEGATGRRRAEFKAPPGPDGVARPWGYIAHADGMLFGSLADEGHIVRHAYRPADMKGLYSESRSLFAMNADTGKLEWLYEARHSIRHNAIAIGAGAVLVIDRPTAAFDRADYDRSRQAEPAQQETGALVALDAGSGRVRWRREEDIFGTVLALSAAHDAVLMGYQATSFRLPSERGGTLAAFRASDGTPLWVAKTRYMTRPVINGRTIYAQPYAYDLLTGQPRANWNFKRAYGCGILAGGAHLLTFRSGTLGYVDLDRDETVENYGGLRPGCWLNAIPAGGLVLVPDDTERCSCSYLLKTSIALEPAATGRVHDGNDGN